MTNIDAVKPQFCPKCQGIMLPRNCQDELYFVCRKCSHYEKNEDVMKQCVYLQNYSETQTTTVAADVSKDPTYPKTKKVCPHCDERCDAVYYYSSHWNYNCSLQIFYKCTQCLYTWSEGGTPLDRDKKK